MDTSYQVEPGGGQPRVDQLVAVGQHVVVGSGQLAAAHPPGQRGALLDDQGVRGHVIDTRLDRRVDGTQQVVVGLPRRAVDQVEADVLEALGHRLREPLSAARPGVCTRSSIASTRGATDCMPSDTRV